MSTGRLADIDENCCQRAALFFQYQSLNYSLSKKKLNYSYPRGVCIGLAASEFFHHTKQRLDRSGAGWKPIRLSWNCSGNTVLPPTTQTPREVHGHLSRIETKFVKLVKCHSENEFGSIALQIILGEHT
jgi:hypothetical protein